MNAEHTETLLKTPLYDEHLALKAKMVPFGGWDMPVQYPEGILAEHKHTREAVAIFDISHMGEFLVEGDCVKSGLDRLVTMPLADMPLKTSRYGAMLNEQGGVMDDLIIFRIETDKWFIVVNASTISKDAAHFRKHLSTNAKFTDLSPQLGKIDIQGPLSRDVLKTFAPGISAQGGPASGGESLDYFQFGYFDLLKENVLISRTGYTGELGYEIFFPWNKTALLWKTLLADKRVKPAGLGARDVLRLEVGYSLYGHELNEERTPLESGLTRFVDFGKEFIGKDALLKQQAAGIPKKIVGIISESRRSPREGQVVFLENSDEIGIITSGTFSPTLNYGIGLALVKSDAVKSGDAIFFGNEKNKTSGLISGRIFYKNGSVKN